MPLLLDGGLTESTAPRGCDAAVSIAGSTTVMNWHPTQPFSSSIGRLYGFRTETNAAALSPPTHPRSTAYSMGG